MAVPEPYAPPPVQSLRLPMTTADRVCDSGNGMFRRQPPQWLLATITNAQRGRNIFEGFRIRDI